MSNLEKQLDSEIREFIKNLDEQTYADKIITVRNFVKKYMHLSTSSYLMDNYDLKSIIDNAKTKYSNDSFPIHLGKNKIKVHQSDLANLCLIEATIGHLTKHECLKKDVKFDKREDKF